MSYDAIGDDAGRATGDSHGGQLQAQTSLDLRLGELPSETCHALRGPHSHSPPSTSWAVSSQHA